MTPEQKKALQERQARDLRASKLMEPNTIYKQLMYLCYVVAHNDSGWGKDKVFCLFKDRQDNIFRTRRIKTLEQTNSDLLPKFDTIEEMIACKSNKHHHLLYGKEYEIVTAHDGSVMEIYGNGLGVIRKGSKIEIHKI